MVLLQQTFVLTNSVTDLNNATWSNLYHTTVKMEVIRGYEQDLSATCADITLLTGKLRLAASQNEVALSLALSGALKVF